ncbi:class I SAM-dependent methyltransferase [Sulfurospirillum sp. T05]|uniref:Class I SAM-dependent methyltransferase n=1 Tax=Sulfurospirillum tamanense TaxID=2813362 RepID=A0ABS2WVY5_9BACT|nr:class I SAM-dependent methyltransferase [Sulfurospirillum tamanensis]MBN2965558.1 class I SAM-dependent methyltransferase [Sulfurospirillum tamanensis]
MNNLDFLHKDFFSPEKYAKMVKTYQQKNDPMGWFDAIYQSAKGDFSKVFWADLEPSPYLVAWLEKTTVQNPRKKACVIGCGVGDDAEALAGFGFEVTAFDISQTAIDLCTKRYPKTTVDYVVADLLDCPKSWREAFDVVYECNTLQVLPDALRKNARAAMSALVAQGGYILVSCRSRNEGEKEDEIPKPLAKSELEKFKTSDNLCEVHFLAYDDAQNVPHYFAVYQRARALNHLSHKAL